MTGAGEGNTGPGRAPFPFDLAAFEPLILAYCPVRARDQWRALFALHRTLRSHVLRQGDPVLAQIRLAWWREALATLPQQAISPDPALRQAASWGDDAPVLAGLVDGYESLLAGGERDLAPLLSVNAEVCQRLGRLHGAGADPAVERLAQGWALAIAAALSPDLAEEARGLARVHDWRDAELPRVLLPLRQLNRVAKARFSNDQAAWRVGLALIRLALAPPGRIFREGTRQ